MVHLKPGAVTVDLETGGVYGDLEHCPMEDLLESAQALLQLLPCLEGRKVWGLGKAYDADCYIYTKGHQFAVPNVQLGAPEGVRDFRLAIMGGSHRDIYFGNLWYEPLVGSVRDGQVVPDTEGVEDLTAPARGRQEEWLRRLALERYRREMKNPKQMQLPI